MKTIFQMEKKVTKSSQHKLNWIRLKSIFIRFCLKYHKSIFKCCSKTINAKGIVFKKKNWVCPLSWQSFWKEKIQKEKKTCEHNLIKWRTKLNWFRTKSKVKKMLVKKSNFQIEVEDSYNYLARSDKETKDKWTQRICFFF
jgi:hypothetical protein